MVNIPGLTRLTKVGVSGNISKSAGFVKQVMTGHHLADTDWSNRSSVNIDLLVLSKEWMGMREWDYYS